MDTLEKLSEQLLENNRESHLLLDKEGRWHHEGTLVEHERLIAALHSWIDRDDASARYILRAGEQWCYIDVEDTPYFVRGISFECAGSDTSLTLKLSDGTFEQLDPSTLRQSASNVLYCKVKEGRFPSRFDRFAYFKLAERVELHDDRLCLPLGGHLWEIRTGDSPSRS